MASVKWLSQILVTNQPFQGYFQTVDYAYWQHREGLAVRVPVTEIQVKAQIARPTIMETVPKARPYRIFGAAWCGNSTISKVEVSTDGGQQYKSAKLLGDSIHHAWRLWDYV